MRYVDLIIFDLDGTLVDSHQMIISAVNFALKKVGLPEKSGAEITPYIGTGVNDLVRKSLGPENSKFFEPAKLALGDYRRIFPDASRLYPGVEETLEYFKQKHKAVITNGKHEFALVTLKHLKIYDCFVDIKGGDGACRKPSSCPLDEIIDKCKVDRKKAIMVGDMDIDIIAGKQAQIATCAVTYGIGKKEDVLAAKPDFTIDSMIQLKEIIN